MDAFLNARPARRQPVAIQLRGRRWRIATMASLEIVMQRKPLASLVAEAAISPEIWKTRQTRSSQRLRVRMRLSQSPVTRWPSRATDRLPVVGTATGKLPVSV